MHPWWAIRTAKKGRFPFFHNNFDAKAAEVALKRVRILEHLLQNDRSNKSAIGEVSLVVRTQGRRSERKLRNVGLWFHFWRSTEKMPSWRGYNDAWIDITWPRAYQQQLFLQGLGGWA